RVEARRLRGKLKSYYETEGTRDTLVIEIPERGYLAAFRQKEFRASEPEPPAVSEMATTGAASPHGQRSQFLRLNRMAIAVVSLAAVLVGGIAAGSWAARAAKVERLRAKQRFEDVHSLANTVLFELHDAIANLPGSTRARELLVKRAQKYL